MAALELDCNPSRYHRGCVYLKLDRRAILSNETAEQPSPACKAAGRRSDSSRRLGVFFKKFMASPERVQTVGFWILVVTAVLVAIVAVGNWQLYLRVERIETILGLRGPQQ